MATEINRFPQIIQALHEGAKVAVRQVAQQVTQEANGSAPYATGALAASGYWVASDFSNYGQAVGASSGANDAVEHLPEVDHPSSDTAATIAYAVNYAVYVHEGTRHMGGRPWLAQAAEGARGRVTDTVASVIQAAMQRAGIE